MSQIPSTIVKGGTLESKTSCFTVSDSSDRCAISITSPNRLILNVL